jgi:two-component system, cell cycle response regulator
MRVLIVEEDAVPRMILKVAVEQFGHECLVAEDGSTAWDMYQNAAVHVIVSSLGMPGMDGLELCRRVRETPREEYTYFIFLTAPDDKVRLLEGIQAGADDHVSKPFDPDELRTRLLVAARITALHQQLTEQKRQLERLNHELFEQGRRDPLTHLGNRLRFFEDLVVFAGNTERYGQNYAAILCDVDCLKQYNNHYGYAAGDEVLKQIAETLAKTSRCADAAYRYGGDEFVVILPSQPLEQATVAAERLRGRIEALAIPHVAKTPPGVVTISIGVTMVTAEDHRASQSWTRRADEVMYGAKQQSRNRVVADHIETKRGA